MSIGFIGQGWIGKNYADDFAARGFTTVRYALEEPYRANKDRIADCDVVFIAVPTPTTSAGFDDSALRAVLPLVGAGKTAVIKSTMLPGTTQSLQAAFPDCLVMHSPEFLTEATAAHDAANPQRNIIGIPVANDEYRARAQAVIDVLPKAPFELVCSAKEAELIKYGGNILLFWKVLFANLTYDLALAHGCDWDTLKAAFKADPRLGESHWDPVHQLGRGAGGHCFIKDFAAFAQAYAQEVGDAKGVAVLESLAAKNIDLLTKSGKDLDLLAGVYGGEENL
jgi:UDPglucose 6-dehydrogenase